jgi:glycosyltransferase involved in cell wall biosynthesis
MNIGVDAYYLYAEHIDGLGNFLLRLLVQLSRIDTGNDYFLYTPGVRHTAQAEIIFSNPHFHLREIPGIFTGKRRLWLQSPSLRSAIIRDRIDLFFAGAEYFPLFIPRSIKVATTIHDVAFKAIPAAISMTNSIFYNVMFPFFVRRADYFFTVSEHSKKEMVNYLHIDARKITVVYNGIDLSEFTPAGTNEKEPYLLFVGTLQPRKNLVNIIKAFALIAGRIQETLVVVGGSGWKNSPLADLVESLDQPVRDRIVFKGYVDGEELSRLFRRARLFVLPSLHEGFCLPILEAMASGTAVLTAWSTAIPEVFGDAVEYADPLDPDDIAKKLLELVSDERKRARFEELGLSHSKKYDVKTQARGFLAAFNRIAAESGAAKRNP